MLSVRIGEGAGRIARMPYWLAKILGRADGPQVRTCRFCGNSYNRRDGRYATSFGIVCSRECSLDATELNAY